MKSKSFSLLRVTSLYSLIVCTSFCAFGQTATPSPQSQEKNKPKVSEAETKAVTAINSAPDAAAKLAAAGEFVKKYPKSPLRAEVAAYITNQIALVADPAQKLTLAENFQKVFTADEELAAVNRVMVDAYVAAKRIDDAFRVAASVLEKHPEDLGVLTQMTFVGAEEAKRQNAKYVAPSLQYGLKAIELTEANKKPAYLDDATWDNQKKTMLPRLYQIVGMLSLVSGNTAEAKTRFEKSVTLNPSDPVNYVLMASILNDEYQKLAQSYKSMPEGKPKQDTLQKATELLDKVIDLYAHAIGVAVGKAEYQQLHDQLMQDVTPYYKFRHNDSTEGLQQLIDKYKAPAKP